MAAKDSEKKNTIVIKKITIVKSGGHGGSWKVAFADFMTAMMAFFLVMWLVNQTEEVKKSVADYFSTPSIIEYNFSNFGVELTLEKLFLDLVNEPLKAFEQFIKPADSKPNIMNLGMKKIQIHYVVEVMSEYATNVDVTGDEITFDIPEEFLFKKGTAEPNADFARIMERVRELVEGSRDLDIFINSEIPLLGNAKIAEVKNTAENRLDYVMNKVENSITHESVDLFGKSTVERVTSVERRRDTRGYMRFRLHAKDKPQTKKVSTINGKRIPQSAEPTQAEGTSAIQGDGEQVYDQFIDQLTRKAEGKDVQK